MCDLLIVDLPTKGKIDDTPKAIFTMNHYPIPSLHFSWVLLAFFFSSFYADVNVAAFQSVANRHDRVTGAFYQQECDKEKFTELLVPESSNLSRRSFVSEFVACGAISGFLLSRPIDNVAMADTGAEVRGTPVNAFNGLAFQYRGSEFNGLTASEINEPSISYQEFVSKLKTGDVLFVEFYAPDGDVAYATLKSTSNNQSNKIRIGEGYPIEQHDGYSSPAFAIRTVKNANIPYKFVVPALAKSK